MSNMSKLTINSGDTLYLKDVDGESSHVLFLALGQVICFTTSFAKSLLSPEFINLFLILCRLGAQSLVIVVLDFQP